jgi:hypothetical protein
MAAPTIDELLVADPADAWEAAGFDVRDGCFRLGNVKIQLGGRGRGIARCTMRDLASENPDGLPISRSNAALSEPRTAPHPNGTVALEHLVAATPALERTIEALERTGLELRRVRDEPTPGGAPRQAFFRLAEVILEVVETPPAARDRPDPDAPARFWGLAFLVEDLERCAAFLGEWLGEPRDAVQPGRRIATLRREVGLTAAVAFITPRPARS